MKALTISHLINDEPFRSGVYLLQTIHGANKHQNEPIKYTDFYNEPINEALLTLEELEDNYIAWRQPPSFSLFEFAFLLDPHLKSKILQLDSLEQQRHQRQAAALGRFLIRGSDLYLILRIEREHLIPSALNEIKVQQELGNLKKQLKVKFVGEEGVDEGGVQKEFFQLIIRQIFDPQYGMFVLNESTRQYWFSSSFVFDSDADLEEFELIGVLLGLAIYNSVILDVHFPFVVYKKLMGVPLVFDDLKDVEPVVWQMLQALLNYPDDDMEEVFSLNFQVTQDCYGQQVTHDLIENGANIPVTQQNKTEFVRLYVKWLLEDSIKKPFDKFLGGFKQVCDGIFFDLFRVEEVELLICGNPELDFHELEAVTTYDNGYSESHPVILNFWQVIHSLTPEQQKQFLFFATGSDRSPIGGLKNLRFVITRHGDDSDRLPQAHTCFNVLLLPEYCTLEKLRDRLVLAINNSTGFGML